MSEDELVEKAASSHHKKGPTRKDGALLVSQVGTLR